MALQEEFEKSGNKMFKHRGTLPLLFVLTGLLVFLMTISAPKSYKFQEFLATPTFTYIALAVGLLGLLIRAITIGYTPRNTSGRNTKKQLADSLNTEGIYATVRHPLYLGNYFMWMACCMLTQNVWFMTIFTAVYWLYYERIMFAEESFLRKKFGKTYTDWASKTPTFVPNLSKWKNTSLCFSWKKVIRKEKNGVFALFFIFFLFDFLGEWWLYGTYHPVSFFWLYMCLITGFGYLILKFVVRKTKLLSTKDR